MMAMILFGFDQRGILLSHVGQYLHQPGEDDRVFEGICDPDQVHGIFVDADLLGQQGSII